MQRVAAVALNQVIAHYSRVLKLSLSESDKADLVQFLKSL